MKNLMKRFTYSKKNYSISVERKPLANLNTVKKLEEFVKISLVQNLYNAKENSVLNKED